jgi:hypothetical protein
MADRSLRRFPVLVSVAALAFAIAACEADDVGGESPAPEEEVLELDLTGPEECSAAGYEELSGFFAENGIEIQAEDLQVEQEAFCSVSMTWAAPEDESETEYYNSWLRFGIEVYDSTSEAAETIEIPERVQLSDTGLRDSADILSEAPEPWEDGFIWSRPDSNRAGPTEVAARIANVVLFVDFEVYRVPDEERCDAEGCVLPSDLVAWLHDEYLPAVGANVADLTGR